MTDEAPRTIGRCTIVREIGRGGMGVVYLARDTRLDRDVAIKALPAAFATDPDRRARFDREARVLATLNHPNIAGLYGVEDIDGQTYLLLEYVEGEDLSQRLATGRFDLDHALDIALQIARALEAAHEKGVVHRDLKPANVKLTAADEVKVLDFGLAKATDEVSAISETAGAESPTAPAGASPTVPGVILGTAGYMSPEQARGRRVDARSDLFSFGCVLYELLTGAPPFPGETVTDALGATLHRDVDLSLLPEATPPLVRYTLQRCLEKDPRRRLQSSADARVELERAIADPSASTMMFADSAALSGSAPTRRPITPVLVPIVGVLGVAAGVTLGPRFSPAPVERPAPLAEFAVEGPPGHMPLIAPDGSRIAYSGRRGLLRIRELSETSLQELPASEGADNPFWSPDGRTLAYSRDNRLWRQHIDGTPPEPICAIPGGWVSGSWASDGTILLECSMMQDANGLYVLRPGARDLERLEGFDWAAQKDPDRFWPQLLPDGRHFVFAHAPDGDCHIAVGSIDSSEVKRIAPGGSRLAYVEPGYILFARDAQLMALPFDAERLEAVGPPRTIVPEVDFFQPNGRTYFSASNDGKLAYSLREPKCEVTWMDREGRTIADAPVERGWITDIALDPDDRRLALSIEDPRSGTSDIWISDLERETMDPLFRTDRSEWRYRWSPSGRHLAFSTDRSGPPNIHVYDFETGREREVVPFNDRSQHPIDWIEDGQSLLYRVFNPPDGTAPLMVVPLDGDAEPQPWATELDPVGVAHRVSPDDRWLAFTSASTGQLELYVTACSNPARRVRVSAGGVTAFEWARAPGTSELLVIDQEQTLYSVTISRAAPESDLPQVGTRQELFQLADREILDFEPSIDGERMLFLLRPLETERDRHRIVLNWPRLLDR